MTPAESVERTLLEVRLGALEILGQIGILEDIGLLSDLLALPPQDDEDPKKRAALAWAMRHIAERGG